MCGRARLSSDVSEIKIAFGMPPERPTPHVLRHTTALHLLQAGVDITVIALWLGHESIETTHVYLEIDLAHKEQALHKLAPIEGPMARFTAPDPLLAFLSAL